MKNYDDCQNFMVMVKLNSILYIQDITMNYETIILIAMIESSKNIRQQKNSHNSDI
jgi:hypothetical protein